MFDNLVDFLSEVGRIRDGLVTFLSEVGRFCKDLVSFQAAWSVACLFLRGIVMTNSLAECVNDNDVSKTSFWRLASSESTLCRNGSFWRDRSMLGQHGRHKSVS